MSSENNEIRGMFDVREWLRSEWSLRLTCFRCPITSVLNYMYNSVRCTSKLYSLVGKLWTPSKTLQSCKIVVNSIMNLLVLMELLQVLLKFCSWMVTMLHLFAFSLLSHMRCVLAPPVCWYIIICMVWCADKHMTSTGALNTPVFVFSGFFCYRT